MDTLVARYTRSPFEREAEAFYAKDGEELDFNGTSLPPLSLKFALPPIPRVSHSKALPETLSFPFPAFHLKADKVLPSNSPQPSCVPPPTTTPTHNARSSSHTGQRR